MDDIELLIDLHIDLDRQGPGCDARTRLAIELSGLRKSDALDIADIGCGTGASSLILAKELNAKIAAVDLLPRFLAKLEDAAAREGLTGRLKTLEASMDALPFAEASLDVVWSEGAIYNIGFEKGIRNWSRFLRPGGILAVSELTWLVSDPPAEIRRHWEREYPEVDMASAKLGVLEQAGFTPIGYFPLPETCWLDTYYRPLQARFPEFLRRHENSRAAREIVSATEHEIALYERFSACFGYGFYVARKAADRAEAQAGRAVPQ